MKAIRRFILTVLASGLFALNMNAQSGLANVDSMYTLISGNWYLVTNCKGFSGKCNNVISDDIYQIERILGTDSITCKVSKNGIITNTTKYLISYSKSYIYRQNRWMLTNHGTPFIIDVNKGNLSLYLDAIDGGSVEYSRTKIVTGIINQTIDNSGLSFFPNPTNHTFSIKGIENIKSIDILDINGKLLQSSECQDPKALIDISSLTKGVYIVKVISERQIYTQKLVIN